MLLPQLLHGFCGPAKSWPPLPGAPSVSPFPNCLPVEEGRWRQGFRGEVWSDEARLRVRQTGVWRLLLLGEFLRPSRPVPAREAGLGDGCCQDSTATRTRLLHGWGWEARSCRSYLQPWGLVRLLVQSSITTRTASLSRDPSSFLRCQPFRKVLSVSPEP